MLTNMSNSLQEENKNEENKDEEKKWIENPFLKKKETIIDIDISDKVPETCFVCLNDDNIIYHVHTCGVFSVHEECLKLWYICNKECIICRDVVIFVFKIGSRKRKILKRFAIVDPNIQLDKKEIIDRYKTEYRENPFCFDTHIEVSNSSHRGSYIFLFFFFAAVSISVTIVLVVILS